jgi:hypothetical protein
MISASLPFSTGDPLDRLGGKIVERIALRDKAYAQAHVLGALANARLGACVTLTGGAALDGVYLHHRFSDTIDLHAVPVVTRRFQALAAASGLAMTPGPVANRYQCVAPGLVNPIVPVHIHVHAHPEEYSPPEVRPFTALSGHTVTLRVAPLSELLAIKLGFTATRQRTVDFFDLWCGMRQAPECQNGILRLITNERWDYGHYTAPVPFSAASVLRRLDGLRDFWVSELNPFIRTVPSFKQVRDDLAAVFTFFEAVL